MSCVTGSCCGKYSIVWNFTVRHVTKEVTSDANFICSCYPYDCLENILFWLRIWRTRLIALGLYIRHDGVPDGLTNFAGTTRRIQNAS